MYETVFTLLVVQPFRLDLTVWALRRREKNSIDRWDGQKYSRILVLNDIPVKLTVLLWPVVPDRKPPQVLIRLQSRERLTPEQQVGARVLRKRCWAWPLMCGLFERWRRKMPFSNRSLNKLVAYGRLAFRAYLKP